MTDTSIYISLFEKLEDIESDLRALESELPEISESMEYFQQARDSIEEVFSDAGIDIPHL